MDLTSTGPVTLSFDWDRAVTDNHVIFHVRLDRGGRHSEFDISLNLDRLARSDLQRLQTILERRHNNTSSGPEITSAINWLLELVLIQDGVSSAPERAARIRELMLCAPEPLPASPKESLFEAHDVNFLRESTLKDFYEQTKLLRGYPEVRRSWQQAVRVFNIGTPKLKADSVEEADELELFFLKLRHEPMSAAFTTHKPLADKWNANPLFRSAIGDIITHPPDQKKMPLEYYILCGWLTSCLWLLTNEDRARLLNKVYGVTPAAADRIRKAIKQLGLKDWTDFQPKGTPAPCSVGVWTDDNGQEWYQLFPQN
jgi:hypothetical protein